MSPTTPFPRGHVKPVALTRLEDVRTPRADIEAQGARAAILEQVAAVSTARAERSLLLLGERGSGKSHLLDHAVAQSSTETVLIQTNPAEAAVPLSGFSAVVGAVGAPGVASLVTTQPDVPDAASLLAAAGEVAAAMRALRLPPTTVFVDDVDRMDAVSRDLIGFVASRLAGTGLRLVLTCSAADGLLAGMTRIDLAPIDARESMDILLAHTDGHADDSVLRLLAQQAGGNAVALVEGVRNTSTEHLRGTRPLDVPLRLGARAAAAAHARLSALGGADGPLLRRVALAPVLPWSAAVAVCDGDPTPVTVLVEAGVLVRRGRFVAVADPLVRSALYWSMTQPARDHAHAELAETLAEIDRPAASWHVVARNPVAATAEDAEALLAGTVQMLRHGWLDVAREYLELALHAAVYRRVQTASVARLSRELLRIGEVALRDRLLAHIPADDVTSDDSVELLLATAATQYARTGSTSDDVAAAADILRDERPGFAARLLTFSAAVHAMCWRVDEADVALGQAAALLADTGMQLPPVWRLTDEFVARLTGRPVREGAIEVDAFVARSPIELLLHAKLLAVRDQHGAARRALSTTLDQRRDLAPLWAQFVELVAVEQDIRAGRLHRLPIVAARLPHGGGAGNARHLLVQAWAASTHGRPHRELLEAAGTAAIANRDERTLVRTRSLQATLAIVEGRHADAAYVLDTVDALSVTYPDPALLRHLADLVEVHAALGDRAAALEASRRLRDGAAAVPSRWSTLARAHAAAILAPDAEAVGAFKAAIRLHQAADSQLGLARTLLAYSRRLTDLGASEEAQRVRVHARSVFRAAGAPAWADRLGAGLAAAAASPSHDLLESLTDEERAIVERVRRGQRNTDIAAALFVSLRTVELRLTRVYRALGVRSRAQLVGALATPLSA